MSALLLRLGQALAVMTGISVLVFLIFFATPGADPAARIAGRGAGPEALAAGTVNAVQPLPKASKSAASKDKARIERYEVEAPDGSTVKVERNIETGESKRV